MYQRAGGALNPAEAGGQPAILHRGKQEATMRVPARPRMKFTAPLLRSAGELHIIGDHEILTIADPDGAVRRLVQLADGSRTTSELLAALAADYPRIGERDVLDAVVALESAGVFEDCAPRRRILGDGGLAELAAPSYL
jgi:hypothetical protein